MLNPYPSNPPTTTAAVVVTTPPGPQSEACMLISKAISALPSGGGTVDARNLTGSRNCKFSPWPSPSSNSAITLLLGAVTLYLSDPWVLPPNTTIKGIGASSGFSANNYPATVFQAQARLVSGPVITLGNGTSDGNIVLRDLAVNCIVGNPGLIGIQSPFPGSGVVLERVKIANCGKVGLSVTGTSNSGTYRDIYVTPGAAVADGTTCVTVSTGQWRGIHGLTCDMTSNAATPAEVGVDISALGGELSDVHVERSKIGVQIRAATQGLVVRNVHGCALNCTAPTSLQSLVTILNGSPAPSVSLSGLRLEGSQAPCIINDLANTAARPTGLCIPDLSVALYIASGNKSPCSTSPTAPGTGCQQ